MAEMTAAEAVAWLEDKAFGQECYSRKQIAQLIEQQQQQIEQQAAEIAKKDRMIEKAVELAYKLNCPVEQGKGPFVFCTEDDQGDCFDCVKKWLEKEAQGVE